MYLSTNKSYFIYIPTVQRFIAIDTIHPPQISFISSGSFNDKNNALVKLVKVKITKSDEFVRVGDIVNVAISSDSNDGT